MAIFGVGAFFDGTTDVSEEFLRQGIACVGWPEKEAPALHNLLQRIQCGDILYIKSHPPGGRKLLVKGIGVVMDGTVKRYELGHGRRVRWIWHDSATFNEKKEKERYNVRNNTLYEEMGPLVQKFVLDLLFTRISQLEAGRSMSDAVRSR